MQNTSSAVMQQRVEPADSLDYFPTPPWATRALCEFLRTQDPKLGSKSVWEPACGGGHMVRPLAEYFESVFASDVYPYGAAGHHLMQDFLWPGEYPDFDWIITNPPFRLAEQFAHTALERAREGVALLVRTAFLESVGRHETLFLRQRPAVILQFTERVPMHKGRLVENGSTATAYCWVVWLKRSTLPQTIFDWIPPCRRALERPGDYEEQAA